MVSLFVAALAVGFQKEEPAFEFIGKFTERRLKIDAVSPKGKVILGHSSGSAGNDIWLLSKDDQAKVDVLRNLPYRAIAVADDGTLLANTIDLVRPGGSTNNAERAIVVKQGKLTYVGPDPAGVNRRPFTGGGLAEGNQVLGAFANLLKPYETSTLAVVNERSTNPVYSNAQLNGAMLMAKFPSGYLGTVLYPTRLNPNGGGSYTGRAAYIAKQNAVVLELPDGYDGSVPTAWTGDGKFVAGTIAQGSQACAAVWKEGKLIAIPMDGKRTSSFIPRGITKDGSLVVGSLNWWVDPSLAVAWSSKSGLQSLSDYLAGLKVETPEGWKLIDAAYVSPDGSFLIGTAEDGKHNQRPFRVKFPIADQEEDEEDGE